MQHGVLWSIYSVSFNLQRHGTVADLPCVLYVEAGCWDPSYSGSDCLDDPKSGEEKL